MQSVYVKEAIAKDHITWAVSTLRLLRILLLRMCTGFCVDRHFQFSWADTEEWC